MSISFLYLLGLVATTFDIITCISELESSCTNECQQTWTRSWQENTNKSPVCRCGPRPLECDPICEQHTDGIRTLIHSQNCLTFDERSNISYVGKCPYNSLIFHQYNETVFLPQNAFELNNFMCNVSNFTRQNYFCGQQRRHGLLCSKCESGLGPAVLSYTHPCVKCQWYAWLLYFILSFVPTTVLCVLVIILRINVLSPPLNAIIFICHVLVSHVNHMPCRFLYYADKHQLSLVIIIMLTVYGLFNMDFLVYVLPPFCISRKFSTLTAIALDYTVAIYPLVLSVLIYLLIEMHDNGCLLLNWVWRPFHKYLYRFRRSWDIKGSILNAFATLYVLSFMKVISTCVNLMLTTHMANICNEESWSRLYYDASCNFFEHCHQPYIILTLIVTITIIILPSLFLFLYPCKLFHKYRCCQCHHHILLFPNEIAKLFQHSFKDGTENTRDCRWFSGIYLLLKIVVATSVNWRTSQQVQVISCFVGVVLVAIFQPHTHALNNVLDSFLFTCLGIIFIILPAGENNHFTQVLLLFIPLLLMIIFICYKVVQKKYVDVGRITTCLSRLQREVCNSLSRMHKNRAITQEKEPLVNKMQSSVLCTVVDIKAKKAYHDN